MFLFQERDVTQVGFADAEVLFFFLFFSFHKAKVVKRVCISLPLPVPSVFKGGGKSVRLCQNAEDGLEVKSYGPC